MQELSKLPIWSFHGELDQNVKTTGARNMRDALIKAGSPPKYTEYKGAGHGMSDKPFDGAEFLDWLFVQHRE
ncbi:MAG TPA: hypothetical protein VL860_04120 [Planctomycetota bacterium]|nr:hypothetical protein [Planctomycetota bacterium]